MKLRLFFMAALFLSTAAFAGNNPLWMRYPAISPDGTTIAFSYRGDIYTVPVTGGKAIQLTTHPAHDTQPVWSPDSKKIAFASNRNGNFDVFVMNREGGMPKQITNHSANEYPQTFIDNERILFTAAIQQDHKDIQFPSGLFPQVYEININGGRPTLFSSLAMESIAVNKVGNSYLYQDIKGYEDPWRKHHQSSITRDVWLYSLKDGKYSKQTTFNGEDRNPVFAPDGNSFYYLSEEKGTFNIFRKELNSTQNRQISAHEIHPVRFLTIDDKGTLCYGYDGEIYTIKGEGSPAKVNIRIISDKTENDLVHRLISDGATNLAVSPNGKEVSFIVRGDVYVTSVEYETTRRITNTPQQERNLEFSPDGRSLVYSAEREGSWGIYQCSLVKEEDKYFTYAHEIKEEALVVSGITSFQPSYSPDGKKLAFLEDRTTLKVMDLKTKQVHTVLDGKYNYSYSDGDQYYAWSPDSKWFLVKFIDTGGWNNTDIALVNAEGHNDFVNLTESGYSDVNTRWVLDGKAMIWSSDRSGYRSHGSWGAHRDMYIMFFNGEAYDKFRLSKEELALTEEEKKDDKEDAKEPASKKGKKKEKTKKDDKKVEPLLFDLANRKNRIIRLTKHSSSLGDALLTPKGDKLYYFAAFEKGFDLWKQDFKENSTKLLMKDVGGGRLLTDEKGENLFVLSGGKLKKLEVKDNKQTEIRFKAEFAYRPPQEREYIFNHIWKQVEDKFYDPTIHGIDWNGYKTAYEKFLPHINNNFDFQEMLSELLGELNGSHTGARYRPGSSTPETATLGAFYDNAYTGNGLRIAEIIQNGPLTQANTQIVTGAIIEKIDGQAIIAGEDYYPLLSGKVGKKILLSVYNPATGKRFEEQVKPIGYGEQSNLLYKRWVENCRQTVDRLSNGRIGYVHVRGMNSDSFREVYSELLGRCRNKEAVVIDTRHNGGGWLHDDLVTLLAGKEYQRFEPREQYIGSDPYNKWLKPSIVLICENNYSNAHGFPWLYKELGIGKLVGTPVPGTMTAVWWETQIDPSLVFGIPQVGVKDMRGNYLENQELYPDIEIYNSPEDQLKGEDKQLEEAVNQLLKTL